MRKQWLISVLFLLGSYVAFGQCPTINDGFGIPSNNPYFIGCSGGDYTIFVQPNAALGQYIIDWGDGTTSNGTALVPPNFVTHTYTATVDTFDITITDITNGCSVPGVVVLEEPVNASIQIPLGGVTQTCAPAFIDFINSSTDVSPTTTFTWTFGDGSPPLVFGPNNAGQTISHQYLRNTVNCNTVVTLEAENYCSFGNPTTAQFAPIQIYDLDDAMINASAQVLCYPDTTVTFTNATAKNCVPQGNVQQRYEYWNFGDHWGLGYDSIVNWQPFDPPARPGYTLDFPGIGAYTIMMIDSNQCGQDTAYITINIVPPPAAGISANRDTICAGENVTFSNNSVGGANLFNWNFDRGQGWQNLNGNNKTRTYNNAGSYSIGLAVDINGGSPGCRDTAYVPLVVEPSPVADFNLSATEGCDSLTVNITDNSQNVVSWNWTLGNGTTDVGNTPAPATYNTPGVYTIQLDVVHPNGCSTSSTEQVTIHQSPVAGFLPNNVCQQALANFQDLSSAPAGDPIISWDWNFGNGGTSTQQNPTYTYNISGQYAFELIVATQHCADTISDTLTVEPKPVAQFTVDQNTGCPDLPVQFTNGSTGAASYQWQFGDNSASTATDPSNTYTNNQLSDTVFEAMLIAETAFGCRDTTSEMITVFGVPEAIMSFNATPSCGPSEVQFSNLSNGAVSYLWDFGDTNSSTATAPSHIYNNQTLFISNFQVQLVATSANGCTDTTQDVVTIYPEPIFPFSSIPDSGCSPLTVTFPALIGAVTYDWDFGDGTTATGQQPSHTFVNNTTNNQVFQVRLIATSSFSCSDTTFEDVVVYPKPTADFVVDTNQGCSPHAINIQNNSIGSSSFQWDFGDGNTDTTIAPNFAYTYDNNTGLLQQYPLSLLVETPEGCSDQIDTNITIYPELDYQVPANDTSCHPLSVNWQTPGIGGSTFQWSFGDGAVLNQQNPQHTYLNTSLLTDTTYTGIFTATSVYGCTYVDTTLVTVYPVPQAQFTQSIATGCTPTQVTFTNTSQGATQFDWTLGNGTISPLIQPVSQTFTNIIPLPDTNQNQLIATNGFGCTDTANQSLIVYPEVSYQLPAPDTGCNPVSVNWQVPGIGGDFFQWDFGDGAFATQLSPQHTYVNLNNFFDSTYTAVFQATSIYGCSYTDSMVVRVFPVPQAQFTQNVYAGCTPVDVDFNNLSQGGTQFDWLFGNGVATNVQQPASQQFINGISTPETDTNRLIVGNNFGCSDTAIEQLIVYPEVTANFSPDTAGCHPFQVPFSNTSSGAVNFIWNFDNGNISNLVAPSETFTNLGVGPQLYNVSLTANSQYGCQDIANRTVTVYHKPNANFGISATTGCAPFDVQVTNSSSIADGYIWNFGDGTTSNSSLATLDHTYFNTTNTPVQYDLELIATTINNCYDTVSQTVTVNPPIQANFLVDTVGCAPLELIASNLSIGASTYNWSYGNGNGSSLANPVITYENQSTGQIDFTLELIANSAFGCSDTIEQVITVYPEPVANFVANPSSMIFPETTVGVINLTTGVWDYEWDFGDGTLTNVMQPDSHTYGVIGDFEIILEISNQFCSDTALRTVSIIPPPPVASFIGSGEGCVPLTIAFQNQSEYASGFFWEFGDGNSSGLVNPEYTYFNPGTYTVKLIAQGPNGTDETIKVDSVIVRPKAVAQFDATPKEVSVPGQGVQFFNLSVEATTFTWNFGDGNSSDERQPSHFYQEPGEFYPELIAQNEFNCPDTFTIAFPIQAEANGQVDFPNAFTPDPNNPGDGFYSPGRFNATIFHPVLTGVEDYHLIIYNRWGELVFETRDQNQGWNGYYRGTIAQQDAYVWRAEVVFINGSEETFVGDVTLLR